MAEPAILLVDELTGNLDSSSGDEIMDVLDLLNQNGTTICMVTHEPRYVDRAATQLNLLEGSILTVPTMEEANTATMQEAVAADWPAFTDLKRIG